MRFTPLCAALAVLTLLAGCATPPSRIQAKPVTDSRFANLDCPLLISERDRRMIIRDLLEDAQGERFRADVISGALTGLTHSMVFSPKAVIPSTYDMERSASTIPPRTITRKYRSGIRYVIGLMICGMFSMGKMNPDSISVGSSATSNAI
jgi:hypothetical protein